MKKVKKISKTDYCQYLLSTPDNYTITHFAEHIRTISHDTIRNILKNKKLKPRIIWDQVKDQIVYDNNGIIIADDTVLDKNYSAKIEEVRRQYSGKHKKTIEGIGIVNLIYYNPTTKQSWLIDYRIFNPSIDGLSKIDHLIDMLKNTGCRKIVFQIVLMDSWYATRAILLILSAMGKTYYCPVKKNRLVMECANPQKEYKPIEQLSWNEQEKAQGKLISLRFLSKKYHVKLFSVHVSTNKTNYIITNDTTQASAGAVQKVYGMRWKIEEFHREVKQVTGIERCQCRLSRIQRNHINCAMLVWNHLKRLSEQFDRTIYQLKHGLLYTYLRQELRDPKIIFS